MPKFLNNENIYFLDFLDFLDFLFDFFVFLDFFAFFAFFDFFADFLRRRFPPACTDAGDRPSSIPEPPFITSFTAPPTAPAVSFTADTIPDIFYKKRDKRKTNE